MGYVTHDVMANRNIEILIMDSFGHQKYVWCLSFSLWACPLLVRLEVSDTYRPSTTLDIAKGTFSFSQNLFQGSTANRVFSKVSIAQHQKPEFGAKPSEIKKNSPKKYIQAAHQMTIFFLMPWLKIASSWLPQETTNFLLAVHLTQAQMKKHADRQLWA